VILLLIVPININVCCTVLYVRERKKVSKSDALPGNAVDEQRKHLTGMLQAWPGATPQCERGLHIGERPDLLPFQTIAKKSNFPTAW